jgi:hypothetical protein
MVVAGEQPVDTVPSEGFNTLLEHRIQRGVLKGLPCRKQYPWDSPGTAQDHLVGHLTENNLCHKG